MQMRSIASWINIYVWCHRLLKLELIQIRQSPFCLVLVECGRIVLAIFTSTSRYYMGKLELRPVVRVRRFYNI